ncbi:hypothetical protein JZ785_17480 [Alicyclobacillus curvatus]|jgi:hypothetical protein|nr:hypothetical protein JZ785_17480 [Alicyclobacillus curvatus]
MPRLRVNDKQETLRQFRKHVQTRQFIARNTVVLLVILAALVYQGSPIWVYIAVIIIYPTLMLALQLVVALFWREE